MVTPTRAGRPGDSQPMPVRNASRDIQSLVIEDVEHRRQLGIERYGTALQPDNGRDALLDAYEEVLDLACYLKQRLVEEAARSKANPRISWEVSEGEADTFQGVTRPTMHPQEPNHVVGFCPACGWESLSLGLGGFVTCSRIDCVDPTRVSDGLAIGGGR